MDMEIEIEMEEEEENINQIIINRLIDIIYSPSFSNISYPYQDDNDLYYNREDLYYNREQEEEILNTSFINDKKKYKTVLANEDDEQLKIIKYIKKSNNNENDKCPIMSTIFEDGQDIIQLPCKHSFEPEAIKQWLKEEKAECPVCRYNQFKTKEIKIEEETRPTIATTQQMSYFTDIFFQYDEDYNN
jgi:hypothetical protein